MSLPICVLSLPVTTACCHLGLLGCRQELSSLADLSQYIEPSNTAKTSQEMNRSECDVYSS